jgi:hypothetical protein
LIEHYKPGHFPSAHRNTPCAINGTARLSKW